MYVGDVCPPPPPPLVDTPTPISLADMSDLLNVGYVRSTGGLEPGHNSARRESLPSRNLAQPPDDKANQKSFKGKALLHSIIMYVIFSSELKDLFNVILFF